MSKEDDVKFVSVTIRSDFDGSDDMAELRRLRPVELSIAPFQKRKGMPNDFVASVALSLEAAEAMARALNEHVRVWREALAIQDRQHDCSSISIGIAAQRMEVSLQMEGKRVYFEESDTW